MKTLPINLSTTYSIHIGHQLLETTVLKNYCEQLNNRIVIMTDENLKNTLGTKLLASLNQQGLPAELLTFPAGEQYKNRETKQVLEDTLLEKQYGRDTTLIALGGGVASDLVGFIAATYCRGIPVIFIPTTLLAMIDASIGGKNGVNTPQGKNLIGTITQPHAILIDTAMLSTLPKREWYNAMAEIIKHSLIADATLFTILQENVAKIKQCDENFLAEIIYTNCVIKKTIVEQDENEQGIRQLLNFGHTIGHAIELIEDYRISHGEAIAIGMLVECFLSIQLGYLKEDSLYDLKKLLCAYDLPLTTSAFKNPTAFKHALSLDKKSIKNTPHFVLLDSIGTPHRHQQTYAMPVTPAILDKAIDWAADNFILQDA
jgi:3-dehydroquinate synthase